jgi:hypothetical protein
MLFIFAGDFDNATILQAFLSNWGGRGSSSWGMIVNLTGYSE